jgi:hypothetical protein
LCPGLAPGELVSGCENTEKVDRVDKLTELAPMKSGLTRLTGLIKVDVMWGKKVSEYAKSYESRV